MPSAFPEYELITGPYEDGHYYLRSFEAAIVHQDPQGIPTMAVYFQKRFARGILQVLQKAAVENPDAFETQEIPPENNPFLASPLIFDGGINIGMAPEPAPNWDAIDDPGF